MVQISLPSVFSALELKRLLPEIIISVESHKCRIFAKCWSWINVSMDDIYNIRDRTRRVPCLYIFVSSILLHKE